MQKINFGIKVFGGETTKNSPNEIIKILQQNIDKFKIYLVIAGTNTSQIQGISAAV